MVDGVGRPRPCGARLAAIVGLVCLGACATTQRPSARLNVRDVDELAEAGKRVPTATSAQVPSEVVSEIRASARKLTAFEGLSAESRRELERLSKVPEGTEPALLAAAVKERVARLREEARRIEAKARRARFSVLGSLQVFEEARGFRRTLFDGTKLDYENEDRDTLEGYVSAEYAVRAGSDILLAVIPNEGFRGTISMRARLLRSPPAELTVLNYTEVNGSTLAARSKVFVPDRSRMGSKLSALRADLDSLCDALTASAAPSKGLGSRAKTATTAAVRVLEVMRGLVAAVAPALPEEDASEIRSSAVELERLLRDATASAGATRRTDLCPSLGAGGDTAVRDTLLDLLSRGIRNVFMERVVDGRVLLGDIVKHGDVVEVMVSSQLPPVNGRDLIGNGGSGTSTTTSSARFRLRVYEPFRLQVGAQAALVKRLSDVSVGNAREIPVNFVPSPGGVLSLRMSPGWATATGQFWWDLLCPSVDLHVFLLRYSAENKLEVGLAGGVGLLNAMVHTGFGGNLMVSPSPFFFVSFDFLRGIDTFDMLFPTSATRSVP